MIDKLDFLFRFWELKARHAIVGTPLAQDEQRELLSLLQLVMGDLHLPDAAPVARPRDALPARWIAPDAVVPVEIRAVSAASIVVTSGRPLVPKSSAILRTTDALSGVEYSFPCTLAWTYTGAPGSPYTGALVVDGVPTREDFASAPDTERRRRDMPISWPRSYGVALPQ